MNRFVPETLLGRTALALALAFLLFGLLAAGVLQFTLVRPHTRQAADDLGAFLVLAAQIWVELPPYTRPDYENEMLRRHELQITQILRTEVQHPARSSSHSYLSYLETALSTHIGQPVRIHQNPEHQDWLWADFPMGGRMMRLGFRQSRLQNRILMILPVLAAMGLFTAFVLSILLVRHITRPLAAIAQATHRIGLGDFSSNIPVTGPWEIAELAAKLNLMEDQIEQLLENRTTLLAGISHDLRTPLARMRLELELLGDDGKEELIQGLGSDIDEMERLISQTLLLARGLGHEHAVETDIKELLEALAADFRKAGHNINCRTDGNCTTQVQKHALERALNNLVENAVNYGGGQEVTLECVDHPSRIDLKVIDQGPGIPESEREKIFQPFHRLESSRSKATGGSGLGLAIVQQLCHANGWRIDVQAADGGTGSVFRISLPTDNAAN